MTECRACADTPAWTGAGWTVRVADDGVVTAHPQRHVTSLADLAPDEADVLGPLVVAVASVLQDQTGAATGVDARVEGGHVELRFGDVHADAGVLREALREQLAALDAPDPVRVVPVLPVPSAPGDPDREAPHPMEVPPLRPFPPRPSPARPDEPWW